MAYLTLGAVANVYSVPMPGMGLGPGIPSFLKTPNSNEAFLEFHKNINLHKVTPMESNPPVFSRASIVQSGKNLSCLWPFKA